MALCLLMTSRNSRTFLKKAYTDETNSDRALHNQYVSEGRYQDAPCRWEHRIGHDALLDEAHDVRPE
jgi:hypothetical protein